MSKTFVSVNAKDVSFTFEKDRLIARDNLGNTLVLAHITDDGVGLISDEDLQEFGIPTIALDPWQKIGPHKSK